MKLSIQTPREFLNPLYSKKAVDAASFERFKIALEKYQTIIRDQHAGKQSEPNIVSNALKPFIESFGHHTNSYSQKGQSGIDLAIMQESRPAVIIEAKTHNSTEMLSEKNPNVKALHEAILYFMREVVEKGNTDIYHIVITDFYSWYVFDANEFKRLFLNEPAFGKIFRAYNTGNLLITKTFEVFNAFEREINKLKADLLDDEKIACAVFHLEKTHSERELISIYKLLSPEHLCKQFNPNDANVLNKGFYNELLYILGLEEAKQNGKKIIGSSRKPQAGTLYENTAHKLSHSGKPNDFETVIGLLIIWINRLLFLKLLESQIVKWTNEPSHKFLNNSKLDGYGGLDRLFFDTLAKPVSERPNNEFKYIPYLNSSLFECHADENTLFTIASLSDDAAIDYHTKTVVKDERGKNKTGQVNTLAYLFEFLDAYDFGSDSTEEIATETKSLINASVLGLIFEKINGYKDGSFYTPSFITMYMARTSIRKDVLDKFNALDAEIQFQNWQELVRYCDKNSFKDDFITKANTLVDGITICDPAVGSGHFLVSALNELVFIKHELGLLTHKGMRIELMNDELLIMLDGEWFEYKLPSDFKSANHAVQKLLFEEKQRIIENQLFGVDINPNSTQITKLRLWIELLKYSYYDDRRQLVTLPNIDINIKTGNSLISRFGLMDDIKDKNTKAEIEAYKFAVKNYKSNIGKKHDVMTSIDAIKSKFSANLQAESKTVKNRNTVLAQYYRQFGTDGLSKELLVVCVDIGILGMRQASMFDDEQPVDETNKAKLLKNIIATQSSVVELESGKIYKNAFEWRFEFPEILDENGDFIGFDVVIGNPPYFNIDSFGAGSPMLRYFPEYYADVYMDKSDILFYFIAKSIEISKSQTAFIISNAMLFSDKAQKLRNHIIDMQPISKIINFEKYQVFDEASITAMMIFMDKAHQGAAQVHNFIETNYDKTALIESIQSQPTFGVAFTRDSVFALVDDATAQMHQKIDAAHPKLKELLKVGKGMETAANAVFGFAQYPDQFDAKFIKRRMSGEIIERYSHREPLEWLLYFEDVAQFDELPESIQNYLISHKDKLQKRATVLNEGRVWWRFSRPMHKEYYKHSKIWCSYRAKNNVFCLDETNDYIGLTNTTVIFGNNEKLNLKYVLALLNSKVLDYRYKSIGKQTGGGVFEYFENQVSKLPIPEIEIEKQQVFAELVDKILIAKQDDIETDTSDLECEINNLTYKLFELSFEDVKIIDPNCKMNLDEYEKLIF